MRSVAFALILSLGFAGVAYADMAMSPSTADSPSTAAYKAGMTAMDQGMGKYTGDPDIDFAANMIPHHQGAIDMAEVELRYGTDPEMRRLASDIVTAQKKEIAQMDDWLAKHKAP
jgi:uncharacterized protein (DUF305 family)